MMSRSFARSAVGQIGFIAETIGDPGHGGSTVSRSSLEKAGSACMLTLFRFSANFIHPGLNNFLQLLGFLVEVRKTKVP